MSQNQEGMKGHNCHVSLKGWGGGPGLALGWHGMEKHSLETSLGLGFQSLFKIPSNLRAPNGLFGYSCIGYLCALRKVLESTQTAALDLSLHPDTLRYGFFSPKSVREARPAHLQPCGVSGQPWRARPCPQAVSPGPARQPTAAGGCCR